MTQRFFGPRIIHQNVKTLSLFDAFHAPRDTLEGSHLGEKNKWIAAKAVRRGDSREQIAKIMAADQRGFDLHLAVRPNELKASFLQAIRNVFSSNLRRTYFAEGHRAHINRYPCNKLLAVHIIQIHYGYLR